MMRPTQERNENVSGVAVSDDGYGRILAHDCSEMIVVGTYVARLG